MGLLEREKEATLRQFCGEIDEQGGVFICNKQHVHLVYYPEWSNLAAVYQKACQALCRAMYVAPHLGTEPCPSDD